MDIPMINLDAVITASDVVLQLFGKNDGSMFSSSATYGYGQIAFSLFLESRNKIIDKPDESY